MEKEKVSEKLKRLNEIKPLKDHRRFYINRGGSDLEAIAYVLFAIAIALSIFSGN